MPIDTSEVRALGLYLGKASLAVTLDAAKVVNKTAHDIEATAKQNAPVDTGNLRNSIGVDPRGTSATVGPTASYAPFVEFGHHDVPPNPFLNRAADQHEPAFMAALEQLAARVLQG